MTENGTTTPTEFGRWLIAARGAARLNQEELADETGIHVNTIKNLESGKTKRPSAQVAAALRERLGDVPTPSEVREEYDRHTRAFIDLMGAYLMALPDDRRLDRIFDLTRYLVTRE